MSLTEKIRKYRFEFYHFIILIIIIIISQITLSYITTRSTQNLIGKAVDIYRWDTAERIADLTTISLELLMQNSNISTISESDKTALIEALDFILTQQRLQRNTEDICFLFYSDDEIIDIDDGRRLYEYVILQNRVVTADYRREKAKALFNSSLEDIFINESVLNQKGSSQSFHVLVPFSIKGEVVGAVYMKIIPDINNMKGLIASSYDQTGALFSAIVLFSILLMYLITNFLVQERDQIQKELYRQREKRLTQKIEDEKEVHFAKRIYHAQHKAEKIMGFIRQDVLNLTENNIDKIKKQIVKYANFVGRVVYDMKNFNPPVTVIRNSAFNTDLNQVIEFIVDNIFRRVHKENDQYRFDLQLDRNAPKLHINEYVIWEIIEPLIQNCIDHNKNINLLITIITKYNRNTNSSVLIIRDNGAGFRADLLEEDRSGLKKIFIEKTSTKRNVQHSGYGCYIAYENCRRTGMKIDVFNDNGALTVIEINHS